MQKYPAAFNNTIQVLLTRSVTLPRAHPGVSEAELAAQPGSPGPCRQGAMPVAEPRHTGVTPEALGTAPLSSASQKPKPRAQQGVIRDQHPLTASSVKLHLGRVGPSGFHPLFCCLLVSYRPDVTRLSRHTKVPKSYNCSLANKHLTTRATECCVFLLPH